MLEHWRFFSHLGMLLFPKGSGREKRPSRIPAWSVSRSLCTTSWAKSFAGQFILCKLGLIRHWWVLECFSYTQFGGRCGENTTPWQQQQHKRKMTMNNIFGALPPPGAAWQMGKTAWSIRASSLIDLMLADVNFEKLHEKLREFQNEIKAGRQVFDCEPNESNILEAMQKVLPTNK